MCSAEEQINSQQGPQCPPPSHNLNSEDDSYKNLCPVIVLGPVCLYLNNFWLGLFRFEEPKFL